MGIKLSREKKRNLLLSVLYKLKKLPFHQKTKLKFFLNLEWIFSRLAHEMSFQMYSKDIHPTKKSVKRFLFKFLKSNQQVLDLGCGNGILTSMIGEKVCFVLGIDHNEESVNEANTDYRKENVEFICADAYRYLVDNKKYFDVLILSHVLEHLDNPQEFLLDFKDRFDFIYIEVPDFDYYYLNHYRKDIKLSLIYSDNDHISEFDRWEMMLLLKKCGITIIESEFIFGIQRFWCKVNAAK